MLPSNKPPELICKNVYSAGGLFERGKGLIRAWVLIRGFTVLEHDIGGIQSSFE